jgi:hypothetical protein
VTNELAPRGYELPDLVLKAFWKVGWLAIALISD